MNVLNEETTDAITIIPGPLKKKPFLAKNFFQISFLFRRLYKFEQMEATDKFKSTLSVNDLFYFLNYGESTIRYCRISSNYAGASLSKIFMNDSSTLKICETSCNVH